MDASVAAMWQLRDEEHVAAAAGLLQDFREGHIRLIAPVHLKFEVPSAIRKAWRTGRVTEEQARRAIAVFLRWNVPTVDDDDLITAAFEYTVQFGCSLYDGLYLALAERIACPFIFADGRLRNAIRGRFPLALWLPDYTLAAER
ncbi:MAG: type II toxin-antitoxin system VapC family toxin [Thermomicrobiales bacterium]